MQTTPEFRENLIDQSFPIHTDESVAVGSTSVPTPTRLSYYEDPEELQTPGQ